ncbi:MULTISPECIES: hypothetical protein [unclassified Mucilaginibacter]|uniref:hypothetical protein n=1 Tax=unclassified Mucilaginibacter TaxID=2617802 RepID=UPI002AC903CC|nr:MULTISPECIES: hypothetical protein [unclassified Mucilaginibacter]MEB0261335.1 hypothetical protein [Mucilaginibacter sp. 10I4]MEB0280402.1 hypothetical protein [Mucilaginibacter sp. 10B2]MEB0300488.1 hypothetical protein [Mucilaginibacter sp. 5C4]WPX23078.1 hypothetical protein RHM67_17500 [Mucilaginibacter sp. 5C4]
MKEIKIKRRWLSLSVIFLVISILLLGFGWINSEVSYKYEVQDTVYSGKPLDERQKDILYYISSSKIELICCVALLVFVLYVINTEPTFKGRLSYYDGKKQ